MSGVELTAAEAQLEAEYAAQLEAELDAGDEAFAAQLEAEDAEDEAEWDRSEQEDRELLELADRLESEGVPCPDWLITPFE